MGSSGGAGFYADTAKRLAGRSLYAVGSGLVAGGRLVAKGVSALTADNSDKEPVCFLKFALLECGGTTPPSGGGGAGGRAAGSSSGVGGVAQTHGEAPRLPMLLVGLSTGFQVWRLDGANPAELVSRRDGPVKLLEALPEPRCSRYSSPEDSNSGAEDPLAGDRPLLAVVPAPERGAGAPSAHAQQAGGVSGHNHSHSYSPSHGQGQGQGHAVHGQGQQQYNVLLYSLRSHGYVRTLTFSAEVLGIQASSRLLVVALRGQLQAFDACTLQHTFSCITYTPPAPALLPAPAHGGNSSGGGRHHWQQQQQQFVTDGLMSGSTSSNDSTGQPRTAHEAAAPAAHRPPPAASLAPFALGQRWLAYAADSPVPPSGGQAVAQRVPLSRLSGGSSGGPFGSMPSGGALEADSSSQLGSSPGGPRGNGFSKAAVADAAYQVAAKGGQQLKAGLTAVGSAGYKYLSQQYQSWSWRGGGGSGGGGTQQAQRDVDALEADAAVAGTVVVRDAASRLVVAHFRAHTSPLACLQFSPGGTLLATASVAGHSINIFQVVPPYAAGGPADALLGGGGAAGSGTGYAVHLYRLYRGVTPAAIRSICFAPDASWVAASSGRGTTHLFCTPAAAPGTRQQQASPMPPGTGGSSSSGGSSSLPGVVGRPAKQVAVGRARKAGRLNGGVAGAATHAARNLYGGNQASDTDPIAAAFLAAGPSSPQAAAGGPATSSSSSSLYVVSCEGLLARHLLRTPAAQDAPTSGAIAASPDAPGSPSNLATGGGGGSGGAGGLGLGMDRQDSATAAAAAAAPVLEEADRWDVARHASWPEREDVLPGMPCTPPPVPPVPHALGPVAAAAAEQEAAAAAAAQQQLWVAQAEPGALAAVGSTGPGGVPLPGACGSALPLLPLWQDPQFRFYELQVAHLQRQRSGASPSGGEGGSAGATGAAEGMLAAQLAAASLGAGGSGSDPASSGVISGSGSGRVGGDAADASATPWLEHVPTRPVQQQQ